MLMIADDFTGAMDTGVKFSTAGVRTKITTDTQIDFQKQSEEVLVLCAPTRHLPADQAYRVVRDIVRRATEANIEFIFKKTDSALRGNIGAELSAVLDGSGGDAICFIPALPGMNRITVKGLHYIDGIPVDKSVFGQDPFEPVTASYIPDLLHQQCDTQVALVDAEKVKGFRKEGPHIYVFDCASCEDMKTIVEALHQQGQMKFLAGCAGLAESLPPYLGLTQNTGPMASIRASRMVVVCGSVNPISRAQMDYGERHGYTRVHIPIKQMLSEESLQEGSGDRLLSQLWAAYCQSNYLIIDALQSEGGQVLKGTEELSLEEIRSRFSRQLGQILKALLQRGAKSRLMIVGGDTLLAFLEAITCCELTPVRELQPGVVLSRVIWQGEELELVSKSGGFGEEDLLGILQEELSGMSAAVS